MQVGSRNFAVSLIRTVSFCLGKAEWIFAAEEISVLIYHVCYNNRGSFKVRITNRQDDNYCSEAFLEKKEEEIFH